MNSNSIRKLRKKFILISMVSIALVMFFMSSFINAANIFSTRAEIRAVLDYLCENNGDMPASSGASSSQNTESKSSTSSVPDPTASEDLSFFGIFSSGLSSNSMSPEFRYSTRYFAVLFDSSNAVTDIKTSHIAAVDEEEAEAYARLALKKFFRFGSYGVYYYEVRETSDGGRIVVFLNCSTQISTNLRIFYTSLIICFGGLIIVFWLVYFLSNRLIQPEIQNVEKQKQFITNASHELKTPLAVIRANTEIEEMMNGENEWTQSTMRQVDRMNGLIQNLVMISRSDEQAEKTIMTDTDISRAVGETADTFESVARQEKKKLTRDIAPDIHLNADDTSIRQLTTVLLDNAIKYCDEGGTIDVQLSKKGKVTRLSISNSFKDGASIDCSRFFERFYRMDEAHNVDKGGYGIGLSIAENIVHRYRGSISAAWKDGIISFNCLLS